MIMASSTALHTSLLSHVETQFVMDLLCQHRSQISFRWMNSETHDRRAIIDTCGDRQLFDELYEGLTRIRQQLASLERCVA